MAVRGGGSEIFQKSKNSDVAARGWGSVAGVRNPLLVRWWFEGVALKGIGSRTPLIIKEMVKNI